jgi:hypothetical protein
MSSKISHFVLRSRSALLLSTFKRSESAVYCNRAFTFKPLS